MVKVVTPKELDAIENEIIHDEKTFHLALEQIGKQIAQIIDHTYSHKAEEGIVGIIGSGIKSLFALKSLLYLSEMNWTVSVYLLEKTPLITQMIENSSHRRINFTYFQDDENFNQLGHYLIVHPVWLECLCDLIQQMDHHLVNDVLQFLLSTKERENLPHYLISVGVPVGIDPENGMSAPIHAQAELTFAIGAVLLGLMSSNTAPSLGKLQVIESDQYTNILEARENFYHLPDSQTIKKFLLKHAAIQPVSEKKLLVVEGSITSPLSAALVASATLPLCVNPPTVAIPSAIYNINASQPIAVDWILLPHELGAVNEDAINLLDEAMNINTILVLGEGLEINEVSKKFFIHFLSKEKIKTTSIGLVPRTETQKREDKAQPFSILLSSQLIHLLTEAGIDDWHEQLPQESILFISRKDLFSINKTKPEQADMITATVNSLISLVKKWQHTIVLMDNPMVIASPNEILSFVPLSSTHFHFNHKTTSVLLGLSASLIQRDLSSYEAAVSAGWMFSASVTKIQNTRGKYISIQPQDIINVLPEVIIDITKIR